MGADQEIQNELENTDLWWQPKNLPTAQDFKETFSLSSKATLTFKFLIYLMVTVSSNFSLRLFYSV